MTQVIASSASLAYGFIYWMRVRLSVLVEHDALVPVLLYMVKYVAGAVTIYPWPYYWGTIGQQP